MMCSRALYPSRCIPVLNNFTAFLKPPVLSPAPTFQGRGPKGSLPFPPLSDTPLPPRTTPTRACCYTSARR